MNCLPLQVICRCAADPASMYSVFLRAVRFAPDQDGKSCVLCLVSSSALWGHTRRQTDKTPIGRWSISSSLADFFALSCASARLQAAQCIGPIPLTLRQHSPGDTRHLVGHGNRRDIHMRSLLQAACPGRYWRRPVAQEMQHRSGSVNEQFAQVSIAMLRDADKLGLATRRDMPRHETEPCGEITPFAKTASSADSGHERSRNCRADARDLHQRLHSCCIAASALARALISASMAAIRLLITSSSDAISDRSMSIRRQRSSLPSAVNLVSSIWKTCRPTPTRIPRSIRKPRP